VYPRPAGDDAGPWALQAVTLGAELHERGIGLHVIEQGIDTDTMDGLATARARGRIAGQSGAGGTHAGQRQMMLHGHELGVEGGHVARLASTALSMAVFIAKGDAGDLMLRLCR
jgi:hypothetical protein